MLKVAVFDDNLDRREGLCLLIDTAPEMTCVGTFEDCRDVVRHVAESNPDVVLMDIDMPHVNGIEGVELIKRQFPKVKVLMQTVFEDDDKVFAAILAGADGYLLKQSDQLRHSELAREPHLRKAAGTLSGQCGQFGTARGIGLITLTGKACPAAHALPSDCRYAHIPSYRKKHGSPCP